MNLFFQPGKPGGQALSGTTGNFEDFLPRIDLAGSFPNLSHIAIDVWQEVDLIDQEHGGELKHQGIFGRFVIAFGHAQNHDLFIFAEIEFSGTNQVPDVFDDQQVERLQIQGFKGDLNHVPIQVTPAIGIDLDGLDPFALNALGIIGRLQISFYHGHFDAVSQAFNRPFQERSLARPG